MDESEEARERTREYKRQWRQNNQGHIREYRRNYDAANRERINRREVDRNRRAAEQQRREEERRAKNAKKSRDYYHANIEQRRAYQRDYLARRKAADPDAYREERSRANAEWRERHRDEQAAKRRDKYRDDPEQKKANARRHYERNAEQIKAKRREYYAANKGRELAAARAWKARQRRRIEAGLPPPKRHRTTSTERDTNLENATLFFVRHRDANAVAALRDEGRTPQRLLDEWQRDCYRARTAHYAERNPELRHDVAGRLSAEERRMDDVAREINARLRTGERRAIERRDAARPHAGPNSQTKGMGR